VTIPKTVKVGGQVYKVNLVDQVKNSADRNVDGQISYSEDLIEINKCLSGDYRDYVLLHEVFHAIYEHCGYKQNEHEIDRLARALHMVIKDNPEMFRGAYETITT
jgi:Zn-dependent peptidase ImmA (M78 family)